MIFLGSRHSHGMRVRQLGVLAALCAVTLMPFSPVFAADSSIVLTNIRAIRISDSSISLSFLTSEETVGSLEYVTSGDTTYTLTDSAAQSDHLFTIEDLDPLHPYTFRLAATAGSKGSNTYVVLMTPASLGAPGQSMVPSTQVVSPDGAVVGAILSASTTPTAQTKISPWLFLVFAGVAVLVMVGNRVIEKVRSRTQ